MPVAVARGMHDLSESVRARDGRIVGDQAQRFVRVLVDRGALALRPGTRVRDLGRRLARAWGAVSAEGADALVAWLLEQEEVEEVSASEVDLAAAVRGDL
jgi:hypothetical protein